MTTRAIGDAPAGAFGPDDHAKTSRPALQAYNLPPRVFHDPDVYQVEIDRIFHREWFCIGRMEDFDVEGGELVRMVDSEQIRVTRSADGSLSSTACVEVWNGFVFVNLSTSPAPLAPELSEVSKWGAENYALADERSVRRFEWQLEGNWKLLVENFAEEYHVAWVHADSFHPVMPMKRWKPYPEMTTQPWTFTFGEFPETSLSTAGRPLFPIISSLTDRERAGMGIVTVYPNLMLTLAVDCLLYYYVLPEGVGRTKVVGHLCLPSEQASLVEQGDDPSLLTGFAEYVENSEMILEEDIAAANRQSIGLASRFAQAGRLSKHELLLSTFHHWLVGKAYEPVAEV
ncbi:SRPBCC family protein [Kribbella sp. NPDC051620]|uniref:aromatic ring-hydroxylating oxygenase subunit alpha n=1 Tax=Kribbella sp. NPDC051620 TaxID=3364120 RepID=UPI0037B08836